MEGITAFILSGHFLGHLPWQCAEYWVQNGQMRPILKQQISYSANFEIVFSVGTQISRVLEIFEEILLSEFSNSTP